MPLYRYRCLECNHEFEKILSIEESDKIGCRNCEGRVEKIFGDVNIRFKGEGFYNNGSENSKRSESEEE